jgi:alpha-L-rhamnosidase
MSVSLAQLVVEHSERGFSLETPKPRLSFRYNPTEEQEWKQAAYEVELSTEGRVEKRRIESAESNLVPWPFEPLTSRQTASIRARTFEMNGSSTPWIDLSIEVALLERSCWKANMLGGPRQVSTEPKRPLRFVQSVDLSPGDPARLYATAWGLYEIHLNGTRVGNQLLTPGWTSYHHRLAYQTYDVTKLIQEGKNEIVVHVAEGWYAGRLGKSNRHVWGEELGIMLQLEIGGRVVCVTDETWECLSSCDLLESEIYDGEVYTTKPGTPARHTTRVLPFPLARLQAPQAAPVRAVLTLKPQCLIRTPAGKRVLDFGQNMVGYIRLERDFSVGSTLRIRHAEVMENGELGTRPLRTARARWEVILGGKTAGLHPKFTFFGFR